MVEFPWRHGGVPGRRYRSFWCGVRETGKKTNTCWNYNRKFYRLWTLDDFRCVFDIYIWFIISALWLSLTLDLSTSQCSIFVTFVPPKIGEELVFCHRLCGSEFPRCQFAFNEYSCWSAAEKLKSKSCEFFFDCTWVSARGQDVSCWLSFWNVIFWFQDSGDWGTLQATVDCTAINGLPTHVRQTSAKLNISGRSQNFR